ncbi:esterase [Christiangramia fulva]|uniref:Esterase n=1 Tax=Christiangramia fulva TaxID=2126553 RepID=A0A2R3Z559_9FLAO|nr:alpha/beta hydrolase [Christiangramia fulva]AVR45416.1 esterase [Christiangramia fulva]
MRSFLILLLFVSGSIFAQDKTLKLWPEKIPNSQTSSEKETQEKRGILWISKVQEPTMEVFLPVKQAATGQAVLIFPGGGYEGLAYDWEGTQIAKWLNTKGIAGIVLKYRLPNSKSVKTSYEAPLQDAKRAIRLIRSHADEWNIDQNQVGIMGFSAGGHLASTLGTHFNAEETVPQDSIRDINARPDFMILVYPVITMKKEFTHMGSRNSLLGKNPSEELVEEFSNEEQVQIDTPPTFLVHATDDDVVPVENSIQFYRALVDKNIDAEMHIYPEGGHGFALALDKGYLKTWTDRLSDWLQRQEENEDQE